MIDSHAHIYSEQFDDDDEMLSRAKAAGVTKIIMPAIDSETHPAMMRLAQANPDFCLPMIGLHPCSVKENFMEEIDIVKRFAKVFEQAYIRFLDLQKAEAQAREAQIEAALERVRSRSMGMHKSEELRDVIQVIYEQFVQLGLNLFTAGFYMDIQESNDWNLWVADPGAGRIPHRKNHIPYLDHPIFHRYVEAKEKGLDVYAYSVTYHSEEKNKIIKHWIENNPSPDSDELLEFVNSQPGWNVSNVLMKNVGLYLFNFELTPFSDSDNAILLRFAKVFEQTYMSCPEIG